MAREIVTQELAKEFFDYDPLTGVLKWKRRDRRHFKSLRGYATWNARYAGNLISRTDSNGYVLLHIFKQLWRAHQIAWLITYGYVPKEIDHQDGNTAHNWIANLRATNKSGNMHNVKRHRDNSSGFMGVSKTHYGRWRARIRHNGKEVMIGIYDTPEDAHAAWKEAAPKYGYHPNHGRDSHAANP